MKLNTRILIGFLLILGLIAIMFGENYLLNNDRLDKTNQIKDVESPISLMVEQVIGYDAMLTEEAHAALLHAQKGDFEGVKEHKANYDEIGTKLDNILKIEAKKLLEKSKRSQEVKDQVKTYLQELDRINVILVDLETRAFEAIDKNDTNTAYSLIVGDNYRKNKLELAQIYKGWSTIEQENTLNIRTQIIQESTQLGKINLYFSLMIFILAIILSFFISVSISKPIKRLKEDVDEITKGKLDIQLNKSSITEVQGLTDSLNRILATMKLAILRTGLSKGELGLGEAIKAKEEAENKYKLLYETSLDARMTLEPPEWKFTAGNPATLKMFNVKDEEQLASLNPGDLSPEKQPDGQLSSEKSKKMIEKAMKTGSSFFEWTHKRYNGESFLATVLLSRIKEGDKTYLQATVRDISKEGKIKEILEASEEKFRRLFETAQDAILILDANTGLIEDSNPFLERLLGYSKKELVGKQLWEISPFKNITANKSKFIELQKKKYVRYEDLPLETKSGEKRHVEFVSNVYEVSGKQIIQCNIRDITERIKVEEKLKEIMKRRGSKVTGQEKKSTKKENEK
jgi:PAS domain S-box-containing protein